MSLLSGHEILFTLKRSRRNYQWCHLGIRVQVIPIWPECSIGPLSMWVCLALTTLTGRIRGTRGAQPRCTGECSGHTHCIRRIRTVLVHWQTTSGPRSLAASARSTFFVSARAELRSGSGIASHKVPYVPQCCSVYVQYKENSSQTT